MDLAIIEERIAELRKRREHLPELREYKPQRKGAPAKAEPVDNRSAEELFPGLFTEAADEPNTNEAGTGQSEEQSVAGPDNGEGQGASDPPVNQ